MLLTIQRLCVALCFIAITSAANSQQFTSAISEPVTKPYKVLTSGKQVTIKSSKNISGIMLWTAGGNRVVEQKGINSNNYTFTVPVDHKAFFLMISLIDGKVYTEKVGVR